MCVCSCVSRGQSSLDVVKPSPQRKALWLTCQANQLLHKLWWLLHLSDGVKGCCRSSTRKSQSSVCVCVCVGGTVKGGSTGYLPENWTARHGIWEKGRLYTSCPSKFTFSHEWKQNATPHVLGPLAFPSPPLCLKIPPSIIWGGFVSNFVLLVLKAEALRVLGSSENNLLLCVFVLGFYWNMFGRSGWVVNLFVLSFLSPLGPMCVALASIHTAVRAGRLCQEGTSVLFVSSSILKSFFETTPQSSVRVTKRDRIKNELRMN